jgi:hypothetical protein
MRKFGLIGLLVFVSTFIGCKKDEGLGDDDKGKFLKTYGTDTRGVDIQKTADGGYILLGTTRTAEGGNNTDIYLKKVDAYGNDQWSKAFGTWQEEQVACIKVLSNDGFAILGTSSVDIPDPQDTNARLNFTSTYLLITDSRGNKISDNNYTDLSLEESNETGNGISVLPSGDIWIASTKQITKFNKSYDIGILRLIDGSSLAEKQIGYANSSPDNPGSGGFNIELKSTVAIFNGDLVVSTGFSNKPGEDGGLKNNVVLHVWNSINGNEDKNLTFGGPDDDAGQVIMENSKNEIVIAGFQTSGGAKEFMVQLIPDVTVVSPFPSWTYVSAASDFSEACDIVEVSDGYVIAGYDESKGQRQFYLEKITSGGSFVWKKDYGYVDFDEAKGIVETDDKGLAVIGTSSDERGNKIMTLLKLDASGNLR